jgi:TolB-like protein
MSESRLAKIWHELLRRKVIRTGLSYSITAWLLIQVFDIVLPAFDAPGWVLKVLIATLTAGLPVAMVLAWSFDIKPDSSSTTANRRMGVNGYLVVVLTIAVAYLLFDKFYLAEQSAPVAAQPAQMTASSNKSIAVLPFKNLSANAEDLYFSDGVMEAILNELSLIRDLKVISRTSVEGYRDTTKPIPEIGKELDVAHVLEGSVQRAGQQVRVTAQLISTRDDRHLWSRNYDRALEDIFAIQSEIAEAISTNLELILTHSEKQLMINAPTSELRAYDLYLRGSHNWQGGGFWEGRNVNEVRDSLRHCQQAVELDPEFALAHVCVATSYLELGISDFIELDEWLPMAMVHVEKARDLDPDSWQVYVALAQINHAQGQADEVLRNAMKVLEINPNYQDFLVFVGNYLVWRKGEVDKGIDMLLRALELMPGSSVSFDPEQLVVTLNSIAPDLAIKMVGADGCQPDQSIAVLHTIASWSLLERDYDASVRCQELVLGENDSPNNRINAGAANLFAGNFARARELYESVMAAGDDPDRSFNKYPYAHRYAVTLMETGDEERGRALLEAYRATLEAALDEDRQLHGNKGAYYDLSTIYAMLGDKQAAVDMLTEAKNRAAQGAFFDPTWLVGDTMLDPLRDYPPFIRFMETVHHGDDPDTRAIRAKFKERLAESQAQGRLLWLTAG